MPAGLINAGIQKMVMEKRLIKENLDPKGYDLEALIDNSCSIEANWQAVLAQMKPEDQAKFNQPEADKALFEHLQNEAISNYMKEMDALQHEEMAKLKTGETPVIDGYYWVIDQFVRIIGTGHTNCLILSGKAGMGKTFRVIRVLSKDGIEFQYNAGCKSPLALYKYLYEHRNDELIIMDDVYGLVDDERALAVLMAASWSATGERILSWDTTSGKLDDVPPKFQFTSRIIICINNVEDNPKVRALASRSLHVEINFTYKQILAIMGEIARQPKQNLTIEERITLVNWLKQNTSESTVEFDLRTQQKLEQVFGYDKTNWERLGAVLVAKKNEPMEVVKELMISGKSVGEQEIEFHRRTGQSRATYHRHKQVLVNQNLLNSNDEIIGEKRC